jgi:uncharacterized membrane protein HdeD (DUF308 family)
MSPESRGAGVRSVTGQALQRASGRPGASGPSYAGPVPEPVDQDNAEEGPFHSPVPPPLTVAASVVAVQGLVLLLLAALEVANVVGSRWSVGVSVGVFFGVYGVVLLVAAVALRRGAGWARGPVLVSQLIALGLAWYQREYLAVAVLVALSAAVVLAGLFHPDSLARLLGTPEDEDRPTR